MAVGTELERDLVEELLARPDDLELRRVIADRLQDDGEPRGELMAVQCALAAAAGPEERERLAARETALVGRALPEIDPAAIELEWRLGFVLAATVLDRAAELVPALLAHPAARLIEELSIAADPEALAAVGAALEARPRPSLLRWVAAGPPAEGRRWIELADDEWVAPLAAAAPGLAVRPMAHVSRAAYEAEIEGDTEEGRNELWILQIAPVIEGWSYQAVLPVRAGREAELARVHAGLSEWARLTLPYDEQERRVRVYHASDRTYVGYANLYRAIRALAPFLEDTRFTISESYSRAVDELAIVRGELRFVRGFAADDNRDPKRDYWYARHADRPRDEELRRFVARLYADDAEYELGRVERLAPGDDDPEDHRENTRRALDRALLLDDRSASIWQLRGRLARAVGELAEAERCFARELVLEPGSSSSFDLALATFAAGQDAAARAHLERLLAAAPGHTGGRMIAGFLADRAGEADAARAHLEALAETVEARRAQGLTPLAEHQRVLMWGTIEPHVEPIVQTGRHAALFAWYLRALPPALAEDGAAARRRGAAAHLLSWAEHFRIRVAHGRQAEESARIAGVLYAVAAAVDPLGGSVHYHGSLFDRRGVPHAEWRRGRRLGRANLERALAINPDHLGALGDLGVLHRDLGEHDRAIELLERYLAVFRASWRPGEVRGMSWDLHAGELGAAYYDRACLRLYGVPAGANRPPGRPSEAALAETDAALDGALAALRERSSSEGKEAAPCYLMKAMIAGFRDQHREALVWTDRALELDDTSPYAWSMRATSQNNLGELDDAATCAALALELDAAYWHGHYVLACVEAKRGTDPAAILARLRRVLELWPEGRAEVAEERDLASLRELPAFRELVGGGGGGAGAEAL